MHFVAAAVLLSAALAAQAQVLVVDAAQRGGADFADLAAAIAAAPDGSVLVVRAGTYGCVDIAGKGLTLLCDANVTAGRPDDDAPFLRVRDTSPRQAVLVSGLRSGNRRGLAVVGAAGPVTVDGGGMVLQLPAAAGPVVTVQHSMQVTVRHLTATGHGAVEVDDSVVVFERCVLRGSAAHAGADGAGQPGAAGLWANRSTVQLVHTAVHGGPGRADGDEVQPGSAAIVLAASSVRAMGFAAHAIAGGSDPVRGQLPPITGIGVARIAPGIPLVGTTEGEPGVLLTRPLLPALVSEPAQPGGSLTVVRHGAPHTLCAVAISERGPHHALPALSDPLWVRDTSLCVESLGRAGADGVFRVQKPVPADPALRGYQVVWQAADLGPNGVVAISNPSAAYVR